MNNLRCQPEAFESSHDISPEGAEYEDIKPAISIMEFLKNIKRKISES